jgi:hypothetical protein
MEDLSTSPCCFSLSLGRWLSKTPAQYRTFFFSYIAKIGDVGQLDFGKTRREEKTIQKPFSFLPNEMLRLFFFLFKFLSVVAHQNHKTTVSLWSHQTCDSQYLSPNCVAIPQCDERNQGSISWGGGIYRHLDTITQTSKRLFILIFHLFFFLFFEFKKQKQISTHFF